MHQIPRQCEVCDLKIRIQAVLTDNSYLKRPVFLMNVWMCINALMLSSAGYLTLPNSRFVRVGLNSIQTRFFISFNHIEWTFKQKVFVSFSLSSTRTAWAVYHMRK